MLIVAFDPGRNVGVAFVSGSGELLEHRIVELTEVAVLPIPNGARVLVGGGTGSRSLLQALTARGLEPRVVDERATTLEARELYYRHNPPRGAARWLPAGMRSPDVPVDDFAAFAIALRWLAAHRDAGREEH